MRKKKNNWVGEFKLVMGQASPYLTVITALMMAATFYHTTLIEWASAINWYFPLWAFMSIIIVGGVVFLWYERKHMVGGFYEAVNEQVWNNPNPMKDKIKEIQVDMVKMQEDINKIKKSLEIK